jgi:3-dehydroquinate synthase
MNQKIIITEEQDLTVELSRAIEELNPKGIFVLCDETTRKMCFSRILTIPEIQKAPVHIIGAGDSHKNLDTLSSVWQFLCENGATRHSVLINLGGGMVTDLGGFAASTFKRGMRYINIPTTLLGAVDAAVGGKTGINFNGLKNEIGVINPASHVIIDTLFFGTLDIYNKLSGYAEILKHGLIFSKEEWTKVLQFDVERFDLIELRQILRDSISVKQQIVKKDPFEKNIRKALNFGHTIGHAIESLSHEKNDPVLHGYAVAWGLVAELYLSHALLGFSKECVSQAKAYIQETYGKPKFISCKDYDRLFELMRHDKKNMSCDQISFTLLSDFGQVQTDQFVDQKLLFEAIEY